MGPISDSTGHDGTVETAGPYRRLPGPRPRDELAAWTTAVLDDGPLPEIPSLSAPSPAGWREVVEGQGLYVRRTSGQVPPSAAPVWCVHGLAGSSTNWNRLARALSDVAPTFAVDLPGHGWSDPSPRDDYDLPAQARLLGTLIDHVGGGPVNLVGNSYGGIVATLLAAERPELVRTLTLISPAVPDRRLIGERGADPRIGLLLVPGTAGPAVRQLARVDPDRRARSLAMVCFGRPDLVPLEGLRAAAAEVGERASLPWVHTSAVGAARSLIAGYFRPGRHSFLAAARRVQASVLVIWGTRDRLVDVRLARSTATAFADSRLLVVAGSGHVAQMEDPEPVARALRALLRSRSVQIGAGPADSAPSVDAQRAVAGSSS